MVISHGLVRFSTHLMCHIPRSSTFRERTGTDVDIFVQCYIEWTQKYFYAETESVKEDEEEENMDVDPCLYLAQCIL